MKRWIVLVAYALLAFAVLTVRPVSGCSIITMPVGGHDPREYVFTGVVVGVTAPLGEIANPPPPLKPEHMDECARGLLVKLEEGANVPRAPRDLFEVFPFRLGADCSNVGWREEELRRAFPEGTRVRVIAREAKLLPSKNDRGNVRLIVGYNEHISSVGTEAESRATGEYDYGSFGLPRWKSECEYAPEYIEYLLRSTYELRRDLKRLHEDDSQGSRRKVLERLAYYPGYIDFDRIARAYLTDERARARLVKQYVARQREIGDASRPR